MRRPNIPLVVLLVLVLALSAQTAFADQVYHSQHIALMPVGGAPLRSGFVENIHVNGPTIYAHEVYVLNGAMPNSTYQVMLNGYLSSATCSGAADLTIPTAALVTNISGDGKAQAFFHPADVAGLAPATVHIRWTVAQGGVIAYDSGCETVVLDAPPQG